MEELKKMLPLIELDRIILRTFKFEDANDIYEYCSNLENIKWISVEQHKTLEDSINSIENYFLKPHYGKYAIVLKEENKVIGAIDIRLKENMIYDIGYVINSKYQQKGYGKEALKGLIDSCFSLTNIKEILIKVDIENNASNHLANTVSTKIIRQEEQNNPKFSEPRILNIYQVLKNQFKLGFLIYIF
ncbi:GNAT family N-acetyltransferase [Spiroplasma taiwanense]|uniref:Acetyltransferase, GNAT family n=1 Tax=Spiroplasma taiwanense CT-1 TaxID=1276220 RepID=S5MBM5_9MOLU|nr:GNAT family N-acetyltransferase [Spiroplasma taiwanense]AGR41168.1 acetyltransferase, GNAT family [Spiroplasma taiwanense CT-1]